MLSNVDMSSSASVSTLAQLSVGLTVCPMGDGYFVTTYRRFRQTDEQRVSFRITTEDFFAFNDDLTALAEAERSEGGEQDTDEAVAEPAEATS